MGITEEKRRHFLSFGRGCGYTLYLLTDLGGFLGTCRNPVGSFLIKCIWLGSIEEREYVDVDVD